MGVSRAAGNSGRGLLGAFSLLGGWVKWRVCHSPSGTRQSVAAQSTAALSHRRAQRHPLQASLVIVGGTRAAARIGQPVADAVVRGGERVELAPVHPPLLVCAAAVAVIGESARFSILILGTHSTMAARDTVFVFDAVPHPPVLASSGAARGESILGGGGRG
jgi:hypothetical protein